ncbi:hypothetical protein GF362_01290 [Candidatus Dojkabacteria bacterium]|nr:hypothetical protein [Candidatus Dojkabacteria bacterium]
MNTEQESKLKFIHHEKGDFLERTVGKLLGVPTQHLTQGTYSSIFKEVPQENIEWLEEKFKDARWQGDVEVHLNHSPFWRQMKRLFEKERPRSLLTRVVFGIPVTLWNSLTGKLMNWTVYNPYAEVVQVFNENKYIDFSKINVAEFIHERSDENNLWQEVLSFANSIPLLLNTVLFVKTNMEALKKLDDEEYDEGSRYLIANSASEGIIDALTLIAGLNLGLPEDVKEALDLSWYEQAGLGIGVAGGISLYSELTKKENVDPHAFFDDKEMNIDSVKKKKDKEETALPPGARLEQLLAA